jgi:hypothetical protein
MPPSTSWGGKPVWSARDCFRPWVDLQRTCSTHRRHSSLQPKTSAQAAPCAQRWWRSFHTPMEHASLVDLGKRPGASGGADGGTRGRDSGKDEPVPATGSGKSPSASGAPTFEAKRRGRRQAPPEAHASSADPRRWRAPPDRGGPGTDRSAPPRSWASRPLLTSPGASRADSGAPAEPRLPPIGRSPSKISGGARQPRARAVTLSAHPTPCSTRSNPHAAIGRDGWTKLCIFA